MDTNTSAGNALGKKMSLGQQVPTRGWPAGCVVLGELLAIRMRQCDACCRHHQKLGKLYLVDWIVHLLLDYNDNVI